MNLLFTLCGRAGSKGCKNKNIREFLGKPLFHFSLRAIEEFRKISTDDIEVCVSTDSADFLRLLNEYDPNIFSVVRNHTLAQDSTPKMAAIRDALLHAERQYSKTFDAVVDLDITSPIRTAQDILNAVDRYKANAFTCVFSVVPSRRNPYFNMVKRENNVISKVLESTFTSRQQAPEMFDMNASIYVYGRNFLLGDYFSPLQGNPGIITMKDTGIIDIDSDEDFELMETIAHHLASTDTDLAKIFGSF